MVLVIISVPEIAAEEYIYAGRRFQLHAGVPGSGALASLALANGAPGWRPHDTTDGPDRDWKAMAEAGTAGTTQNYITLTLSRAQIGEYNLELGVISYVGDSARWVRHDAQVPASGPGLAKAYCKV